MAFSVKVKVRMHRPTRMTTTVPKGFLDVVSITSLLSSWTLKLAKAHGDSESFSLQAVTLVLCSRNPMTGPARIPWCLDVPWRAWRPLQILNQGPSFFLIKLSGQLYGGI
jgi:hypothetical protein